MLKSKKGFTLIELLIVVAIIGILAAIAIPAFSKYRAQSYNTAAVADIRNVKTGLEAYQASVQSYPNNTITRCPQAGACVGYPTAAGLIAFAAGAGGNTGSVFVANTDPSAAALTANSTQIDPQDQLIGKTSTGVQLAINYNTNAYELLTQHIQGTRVIGTAFDLPAIYYRELGVEGTAVGTQSAAALNNIADTGADFPAGNGAALWQTM